MRIITPPKPWPQGAILREYAKNQPKYQTMPALVVLERYKPTGKDVLRIISCWRPSLWERVKILFAGRLYVHLITSGSPQPQLLTIERPK